MNLFNLFGGLGRWTIHLDESFLEWIPSVDSSRGYPINPYLSSSSECDREYAQHNRAVEWATPTLEIDLILSL
ncbi:hypothetical protein Tco_0870786, partial [Tanacetum coccineum]